MPPGGRRLSRSYRSLWALRANRIAIVNSGSLDLRRQNKGTHAVPRVRAELVLRRRLQLAIELYQRRVPFETVERAVHLGCLRKYAALLKQQGGTLITSLHYFTLLLEEVQRTEISDQYWSYIRLKLRQLEQQWQLLGPASNSVSGQPGRRNDETSETK